MYLPRTLITLSIINWSTSLPVPDNGQAAMTVPTTSPHATTVSGSFEKRQPAYAPVETYEPIMDALAGSGADVLKERANGPGNGFDSLLCATLKALKVQSPATFTSLLQSCTQMIDSSPHRRTMTLKERIVIDDKRDLAANAEATDNVYRDGVLRRSETDLPEKRGLGISSVADKRQDEGLDDILAPL